MAEKLTTSELIDQYIIDNGLHGELSRQQLITVFTRAVALSEISENPSGMVAAGKALAEMLGHNKPEPEQGELFPREQQDAMAARLTRNG